MRIIEQTCHSPFRCALSIWIRIDALVRIIRRTPSIYKSMRANSPGSGIDMRASPQVTQALCRFLVLNMSAGSRGIHPEPSHRRESFPCAAAGRKRPLPLSSSVNSINAETAGHFASRSSSPQSPPLLRYPFCIMYRPICSSIRLSWVIIQLHIEQL